SLATRVGAELEVLGHGQLGERAAALGDVRDSGPRHRLGAAAQRLPAEVDPPRAAHGSRDRPQRRRLSGAVRAEDGDDRAFGNLERDAAQGLHRAVAGLDALEREQRAHSSTPRYASITAGSACTSAGGPEAILRPKLSTLTWSEIRITRLMWCSTSRIVSAR